MSYKKKVTHQISISYGELVQMVLDKIEKECDDEMDKNILGPTPRYNNVIGARTVKSKAPKTSEVEINLTSVKHSLEQFVYNKSSNIDGGKICMDHENLNVITVTWEEEV